MLIAIGPEDRACFLRCMLSANLPIKHEESEHCFRGGMDLGQEGSAMQELFFCQAAETEMVESAIGVKDEIDDGEIFAAQTAKKKTFAAAAE